MCPFGVTEFLQCVTGKIKRLLKQDFFDELVR